MLNAPAGRTGAIGLAGKISDPKRPLTSTSKKNDRYSRLSKECNSFEAPAHNHINYIIEVYIELEIMQSIMVL